MIGIDTSFFGEDLVKSTTDLKSKASDALESIINENCVGSEWTGWFDWPKRQGFALAKEIHTYKEKIDVAYDTVVVIGIGGSYLGTRAVCDALKHDFEFLQTSEKDRKKHIVYAGHNLSEAGLIELLDALDQLKPIVNVISKSGTTTEPSVAFRVLRNYMEKRFGKEEANQRIVATTDKEKGVLRKVADEASWKTFVVPDDVGGRFSVLTAVGLLPLALAGYNINALLEGADIVFDELSKDNRLNEDHPILTYAAARLAAWESGKRMEVLAYGEPKFHSLVEWWKQLFGESEGKDGLGLFPAGLASTTDLHSLGQYLQDGHRSMIETFLYVEKQGSQDNKQVERRLHVPALGHDDDGLGYLENRYIDEVNKGALDATKVAHHDGGVPCLQLTIPGRDEKSIGALFAFFETACAVSGLILGVNPFDQPGVETYKKNLFGLMGKPGFEEMGQSLRKRL